MVEQLTGLGYGIIGFAVLIGIGILIIYRLGANVSSCPTGFTYNTNGTATYSTNVCCNNTASSCSGTINSSNPSTATQTMNSVNTMMGTTNGGLASWIPIIIVMTIGLLFLGWFMTRKGSQA